MEGFKSVKKKGEVWILNVTFRVILFIHGPALQIQHSKTPKRLSTSASCTWPLLQVIATVRSDDSRTYTAPRDHGTGSCDHFVKGPSCESRCHWPPRAPSGVTARDPALRDPAPSLTCWLLAVDTCLFSPLDAQLKQFWEVRLKASASSFFSLLVAPF